MRNTSASKLLATFLRFLNSASGMKADVRAVAREAAARIREEVDYRHEASLGPLIGGGNGGNGGEAITDSTPAIAGSGGAPGAGEAGGSPGFPGFDGSVTSI